MLVSQIIDLINRIPFWVIINILNVLMVTLILSYISMHYLRKKYALSIRRVEPKRKNNLLYDFREENYKK